MLARKTTPARRRGATVVEVSLLLSIFLMFLFGIFEYGRYLMTVHIVGNAAREGVRYATVHVFEEYDFDTRDSAEGLTNIRRHVIEKTGGVHRMLTPPIAGQPETLVEVFPCNNAQLFQMPSVATPKPGWGTNPDARTVHWNAASFSERIAVRVSGRYTPLLPNFLWLSALDSVSITAVAG
jgi:Flp pilus assembly protein TadG